MEDMFIVETSARHIHLSDKDLATLFGEGHQKQIKKIYLNLVNSLVLKE